MPRRASRPCASAAAWASLCASSADLSTSAGPDASFGGMRPSVHDLRAYYATRDGQRVARQLAATVAPAIRQGSNARLLALGYCAPLLRGLDPRQLERMALVLPEGAGVRIWPRGKPS